MLPKDFLDFLVNLSPCFTAPSFLRFQTLLCGWILCTGKHTITNIIRAAGVANKREHSAFHRFFSRGRWETNSVGLQIMKMVLALCPSKTDIILAIDDSLARHTGKHIASAGMHRDPLLSTGRQNYWHFGHNWVVVSVVIHVERWNKRFSLPVLARLYRTEKLNKAQGVPHKKKTELANELIQLISEQFPRHSFQVVADNAYINSSLVKPLPLNMHLTGRGRMDSALYDKPVPTKNKIGRPRVKGKRLPSPENHNGKWKKCSMDIYGRPATIEVKIFDALWYRCGGGRLLRFVVVRGWPGHSKDDVLVTTDTKMDAEKVIALYCQRWTIEETFHWVKDKLGFQDPQNRTERAVQRTAPIALWSYSLVILWYLNWAKKKKKLPMRLAPWFTKKKHPSFSDMLATLRRESWTVYIADLAPKKRFNQNEWTPLLDIVGYG